MNRRHSARRVLTSALLLPALFSAANANAALIAPQVDSIDFEPNGDVCVIANVPPGFRHAVLERYNVATGQWENLVAGSLNGASNSVTMIDDSANIRNIYRVTAGESTTVPAAPFSGEEYFASVYNGSTTPITGDSQIGHVLNRIAYGPTAEDYTEIQDDGVVSYIEKQLDPSSIDESANTDLNDGIADLFYSFIPGTGTNFLGDGSPAVYLKGNAAPPSDWMTANFDDTAWAATTSPVGYGPDLDFAAPLSDMRIDSTAVPPVPGYYSFYMRQVFSIDDVAALENFFLDMRYDDSYVAYINGTEVARANISGTPTFDQPSDANGGNFDNAGLSGVTDLSPFKPLLNAAPGTNVLAVEVHNANLTSSDSGAFPTIVSYPDAPFASIKGSRELQHLVHLRGVYAKRQLQAVLGEFWENHFTTDFDKLEDYLLDLDEFEDAANVSDNAENMIELQAEIEAARMEWQEYEFFHTNALGDFGDLLLYSATSPAMLIYLDSVNNTAANPNENYPREILELSAFGVDNGYTQTDIEQLSKCFTGWTIRKVRPEDQQTFPESARTPPITDSVSVGTETIELDLGAGWKYFKGTAEPTPDGGGLPTTAWAQPGFDDTAWLDGSTGIGYGDGDDTTELTDMLGGYTSVYLRREFTLDVNGADNLVMGVDYDDAYVAYLNGVEIDRSPSMGGTDGTPPTFNATPAYNREAGNERVINLAPHLGLINAPPATNVLAIQGHNAGLTSSDFSILPRILSRTFSADSIPVIDPSGIWTFRFDPDEHNLDAKTIFAGTTYQIDIPADRTGIAGVNDAIDIIDAMVSAPPCAQFICLKLVNRFVSDEISLDTFQNRTAPHHLLETMDNAVAAWHSTDPPGNIATVMRAVLDMDTLTGSFWQESTKRTKVKNPIEFINSSFRAIGAKISDERLPIRTTDMGMYLFTRDEPDGFDEIGISWTDTQSLLERMKFAQGLTSNRTYSYGAWDIPGMLATYSLGTGEEILDHFETVLFQGDLPAERRSIMEEFMNTDENGNLSPIDNLSGNSLTNRVEALLGLILSTPEFQFQ